MGLPFRQSFTTTGAKAACFLDWTLSPFNATLAVVLVGGATCTYGVQYTLDDPSDSTQTARWIDDPVMPTGTTVAGVDSLNFPVQAVRINITAISGTVEFKVIQGLQKN